MDISISRLNNRMSLQVPAELPLGLVFIVGQVTRLQHSRDGKVVFFELVEGSHRLPCRLPGRVARETLLREGDRARAGGRLLFNSRLAGYLLVARDVEVLPKRSAEPSLQSIIEDAQARKAQTQETQTQPGAAVQSDLPAWVTRLAPPEVRRELDLQAEVEGGPIVGDPELGASGSGGAGISPELDAVAAMETETPAESDLSPEMVTFLSQAIDSDDEIELTAEMIGSYLPQTPDSNPQAPPAREDPTARPPDDAPADRQQAPARQPAATQRAPLPLLAALLVVLLLLSVVLALILTQA